MSGNGYSDTRKASSGEWRGEFEEFDNQWLTRTPPRSNAFILLSALLASLVLHLMLLQWHFPSAERKPVTSVTSSIVQHLVLNITREKNPALPNAEEIVQYETVPKPKVQNDIPSPKTIKAEKPLPDSAGSVLPEAPSITPVTRTLTPATARDINKVIQQISPYHDAITSGKTNTHLSNQKKNSEAFGDVFDPRLRERLQSSSVHAIAVEPREMTETVNAQGDVEVHLSKKRCMKAKESRIGEARNWLLTACSDRSDDEGELMLQRVNESLRGRR